MSNAATLPTRRVLSDRKIGYEVWRPVLDGGQTGSSGNAVAGVRIKPNALVVNAPNGWLQTIESRIRASIKIDEHDDEPSTEWLNEGAAGAAITFFRLGADLLPAEPHISATRSGDLVAEFETPYGNLTCVVSERETILFAVPKVPPREPVHGFISSGSKRFREELRSFTQQMFSESHGALEAAAAG